jgi:hypothetical protein
MLREPPAGNSGDDTGGDAGPAVAEVLRAALAPLIARIDAAFIYGPTARSAAAAQCDIDVMIIGRGIAHADVIAHLIQAARHIGRAIHPSVYSADEWARKLADGNRVTLAVMKQRKIFLIGSAEGIPQPR